MKYAIIRRYAPHIKNKPHLVKFVTTLEAAQAHCNDSSTRKAGEWFDGYTDQVTQWEGKPALTVKVCKDNSITAALIHAYR